MKIVCFEGIDGSGKTTQSLITATYLSKKYKINVIVIKPFSFSQILTRKKITLTRIKLKKRIYSHTAINKTSYIDNILDFGKLLVLTFVIKIESFFMKLLLKYKYDIIIYDRFYYDKIFTLLSTIKLQLLALSFIPKPDICFILDVPTVIAYSRMQQSHDKIIPLHFFEYLRYWYILIGKLSGCYIIDVSNDDAINIFRKIKVKIDIVT